MTVYEKYYLLITECEDLISEAGEWKIVFRGGKKKRKLVCPPGMKAVGKTCKKMGSKERTKRRKALKIAGKKAKQKMGRILKKRAKALKKRKGLGI